MQEKQGERNTDHKQLNFDSSTAGHEFLDLAIARRPQNIEPRDLVNLLAKAERLGYTEMDVITDNELTSKLFRLFTRHMDAHNPVSTQLVP